MKEIDYKIRAALAAEEASMFDDYDELNILEQVSDSFKRKSVWLILMTMFATLAFVVMAGVCAFQFFNVESVRELIGWSIGFVFCCLAVGMMKVWYWMELNKNAVTREMKRVELQLASIGKKIDELKTGKLN